MSEGKGEGRAVPPETPRVPIIFTACLFVFWQTAQAPGLMAASEQAATCCPYGSESRSISGCWADKEADQWLAVSSRGLLHPGNSPWWLLSTVQGSVLFRVGPFVLMPAGDGEVPWGSGLKAKKDKVGLLRGDLGNGAAGQGLGGQLRCGSADGRRGRQLSLCVSCLPSGWAPRDRHQALLLSYFRGALLEMAPHPEPGLTLQRAGLVWCSVAAAQSRGWGLSSPALRALGLWLSAVLSAQLGSGQGLTSPLDTLSLLSLHASGPGSVSALLWTLWVTALCAVCRGDKRRA